MHRERRGLHQSGRRLVRDDRHGDVDDRERVDVGHVVSRIQRTGAGPRAQQRANGAPLVEGKRRTQLDRHARGPRDEAAVVCDGRGPCGELGRSAVGVGRLAPVHRQRRALALDEAPEPAGCVVEQLGGGIDATEPALGLGHEARAVADVELESVVPRRQQSGKRHEPAHLVERAARDAGDEPVAPDQAAQQVERRVRHLGQLRAGDDRCEDAVDVEQHGGAAGIGAERVERVCCHALVR